MNKNEWSLIGFTLLTQASVGLICCFFLLFAIDPQILSRFENGFSFLAPDFVALIFMAVSTTLSFFHLGKPQHAPNVFRNLKSSWLSREVFGLILFGTALIVLFIVRITGFHNNDFIMEAFIIAVFSGLLLLFFMSKIYKVKTIPPWNSSFTWQSFYLSAFVLGSLFTLLISGFSNSHFDSTPSSQSIILSGFLMMFLIFESISLLPWYLHLKSLKSQSPLKPDFNTRKFLLPLALRVLLIIVSAILAMNIFYSLKSEERILNLLLLPLIILALTVAAGEILGRWLFYKSYYRIGV